MKSAFTIASGKGGSGKTATALALSVQFVNRPGDKLVALLDLDPEGYATAIGLGQSLVADPLRCPSVSVRLGDYGMLQLYPAGAKLAHASESDIQAHIARVTAAADLIIIDTPPARSGAIVRMALRAATRVVSPVLPDFQSYGGFTGIVADIAANAPSTPVHALLSRWDGNTLVARSMQTLMRQTTTYSTLTTIIPRDQRVVESLAMAAPVSVTAPRSRAATAFRAAAIELARLSNIQPPR